MSSAPAFEWLCVALERETELDRLQARGTVRLTFREAGLDPASVTTEQAAAVVNQLLAAELESRAVEGAAALCGRLSADLGGAGLDADEAVREAPEDVFRRLAEG